MSVESILKIGVEDSAFQRFHALWQSYEKEVKKQPELWAKISKSHRELSTQWGKVATTFAGTLEALERANDELGDQEKHLTLSERLWSNMEKTSRGFASNIAGATGLLLKWTGIASGISGLLGYFSVHGLDRLGTTAAGWRQSAMGLGVSTGQQRAFNIAFDRLLPGHTDSFLSGINAMVSNIAAQGPLYTLGVNPNAPTADVAVSTLRRLREIATSTPVNQLGIQEQIYGLQNMGIGVEDLRRLKSMSGGEFNQLLGTYGKQSGALNLNDRTTRTWQNFVTTMDLAKGRIENVFVRGLAGLAGPVERLAGGFAHLLEVVMRKDGSIEHAINTVAKWMDTFNGKISKPEFLNSVSTFTADVGKLGRAFHDIAHPLDAITDINKATLGVGWNPITWLGSMWSGLKHNRALEQLGLAKGLPAGLLEVTSGLGTPDAARVMGVGSDADSANLLSGLLAHYHGNVTQALAAYDWGAGNLDALLSRLSKMGKSGAWESYLPGEQQSYLATAAAQGKPFGLNITITNRTGSDVNASVAAQGAMQ